MSSTNRGAVRDLDDHYATPPDLARLICAHLRDDWYGRRGLPQPLVVMEPGCGEGAFLRAVQEAWPGTARFGVEVNAELAAEAGRRGVPTTLATGWEVVCGDFLSATPHPVVDLAATNPPFVRAQEFVQRTLLWLKPGGYAAFLLRLNFLGGKERYRTLWRDSRHYRHKYVLPARISFTSDNKTDSVDYGVFVFSVTPSDAPVTESFLDNTGIRNRLSGDEVRTSYRPNSGRK